jgi:hypothetical protein
MAALRRRLASREAARWQSWQQEETPAGVVGKSARGLAWPQTGQRLLRACWTGEQEPIGS